MLEKHKPIIISSYPISHKHGIIKWKSLSGLDDYLTPQNWVFLTMISKIIFPSKKITIKGPRRSSPNLIHPSAIAQSNSIISGTCRTQAIFIMSTCSLSHKHKQVTKKWNSPSGLVNHWELSYEESLNGHLSDWISIERTTFKVSQRP